MATQIEVFPLGPLGTNCYVVRGGDDCWVVDPGLWPEQIIRFFRQAELGPTHILLTHAHGDHIAGVTELKSLFPECEFLCPVDEVRLLGDPAANMSLMFGLSITAPEPDATIAPGDELRCGSSRWKVLDSRGHSPGGVSLYCAAEKVVLTGDALFAGSVGRTDIPYADGDLLIRNIRDHLFTLPGDTRVFPGHGEPTTIAREKAGNMYVRD